MALKKAIHKIMILKIKTILKRIPKLQSRTAAAAMIGLKKVKVKVNEINQAVLTLTAMILIRVILMKIQKAFLRVNLKVIQKNQTILNMKAKTKRKKNIWMKRVESQNRFLNKIRKAKWCINQFL